MWLKRKRQAKSKAAEHVGIYCDPWKTNSRCIQDQVGNANNQWSQELVFWHNKYIDPILVKLNTAEKYDPI